MDPHSVLHCPQVFTVKSLHCTVCVGAAKVSQDQGFCIVLRKIKGSCVDYKNNDTTVQILHTNKVYCDHSPLCAAVCAVIVILRLVAY